LTHLPLSLRARFSLVIPVFNEEAVLPRLFARLDGLLPTLRESVEILLVDDGSRDSSAALICEQARRDPRYRYIGLSRNFGHQNAISAGLDLARGDAAIVMDADLQDPPEVIHELIARWKEGYDIVHARRRTRAGENLFKRYSASLFYRALRQLAVVDMPSDVGDFRLVGRLALDTFRNMPERDRYVRGMFGWMGYRQTVVEFDRDPRASGRTKYSLGRMMRLAIDGVVGFSDAPLRFAVWCGSAISLAALSYGGWVFLRALVGAQFVSGWASLAVLISLLSGINLSMLGVIGIYVGRIHNEAKRRPLYLIARDTGGSEASEPGCAFPLELERAP